MLSDVLSNGDLRATLKPSFFMPLGSRCKMPLQPVLYVFLPPIAALARPGWVSPAVSGLWPLRSVLRAAVDQLWWPLPSWKSSVGPHYHTCVLDVFLDVLESALKGKLCVHLMESIEMRQD